MTNPYLQIAEEITGEDLTTVSAPRANPKIPNKVKRIQVPPKLKLPRQSQPLPKTLPQGSAIGPVSRLGNFGALSGFSKIRKMVFLAAIGAGFAASKMFFDKYEVLLLAEHPEYNDLRSLLPKAEKVLLPATGLFAFPVALALFTDQEWPMLTWICWLGALAYTLKETGPDVMRIVKETKSAVQEYKETKLAQARKRARKRK